MFAASRFATTAGSRRLSLHLAGVRIQGLASVGDAVPSVELHSGFPPEKINLAEYSKDKKMILLGLPGAFTPT